MMVQNGCDAEHFISGGHDPSPESRILDIESLPRPIVSYMGDVAPWVDIELFLKAARSHPEWSIVILGTWKRDKGEIQGLKNVHAPGSVPYDELPYYARRFDVGTIPFQLNELTRVVNPLKLYEYFSLGMPVVASDLPEVARFGDLVYIYRDLDQFVPMVEKALSEGANSPLRRRRIELAAKNSWRSRADVAATALNESLATK